MYSRSWFPSGSKILLCEVWQLIRTHEEHTVAQQVLKDSHLQLNSRCIYSLRWPTKLDFTQDNADHGYKYKPQR